MARVYISIGSSLEREKHVRAALDALSLVFAPLTVSTVFESEAVGFDGDNFYNLVIGFDTDWSISRLHSHLRTIEAENGRVRDGGKFKSRTLDLDLLLYDDVICEQPAQLPRYEITEHAFVLQPLAEIAPYLTHPVNKTSILSLWQSFDCIERNQRQWPVNLVWDFVQPELETENNEL